MVGQVKNAERSRQVKKSSMKRQRRRLDALAKKAQQSLHRARKLSEYVVTSAYRSALRGENDFLEPTLTHDQYRERVNHFDGLDSERLNEMLAAARSLPNPTAQKWDRPFEQRIAVIADDFLLESLDVAADFRPLTPDNFSEVLPECDLLLVVSAWRGLNGEWHGFGNANSDVRILYREEIEPLARELSIPVAFYSKEDPPNFKKFVELAESADCVFTSAEEVIPLYEKRVRPGVPVRAIRFAVNYQRHNPLGCERYSDRELMFAGSWLSHKYKERLAAAQKIFDGANESRSRLTIFDRNLALRDEDFHDLTKYQYPDKYLESLRNPLEHDQILQLQKLLPLAINLNSVTSSATMFANRVVELLAMGTVVISNYSNGVNSRYPYVTMIDSETDVQQFVDNMSDEYFRYSRAEGIREVFSRDTAFDRMLELLSVAGFEVQAQEHTIYVVAQSKADFDRFRRTQATEHSLKWVAPADVATLKGSVGGDVIFYADRVELESPDLVNDVVSAFRFSDVDGVELCGFDDPRTAYEIEEFGEGLTGVHALWLAPGKRIEETAQRSKILVRTSASAGFVSYSSDEDAVLSVIVPVYNNGSHLVHKCFQSLLRSSVFERARILLVDDGSTDLKTQHQLRLLDRIFDNVDLYQFPEGGSGSASRPRNKGLELARTKYVTYLDPDNEQTNDAYARLLKLMERDGPDFAIGNMVRFKGKRTLVNNSWALKKGIRSVGIEQVGDELFDLRANNAELLRQMNYQPMSIQALVANREWLSGLGLEQPVGAVGQDSYFFQQMLYYARYIVVTPLPVHIYYAEVANSTVNAISPKFYRKYLPLEQARSDWLKEIGLHQHYSEGRFVKFLKLWYLKKLELVSVEEREESFGVIEEIASIYGEPVTGQQEYREAMAEAYANLVDKQNNL